jgi:hypothetical protein
MAKGRERLHESMKVKTAALLSIAGGAFLILTSLAAAQIGIGGGGGTLAPSQPTEPPTQIPLPPDPTTGVSLSRLGPGAPTVWMRNNGQGILRGVVSKVENVTQGGTGSFLIRSPLLICRVVVEANTKLYGPRGGRTDISTMVGHLVTVLGTLTGQSACTVNARIVRDHTR